MSLAHPIFGHTEKITGLAEFGALVGLIRIIQLSSKPPCLSQCSLHGSYYYYDNAHYIQINNIFFRGRG